MSTLHSCQWQSRAHFECHLPLLSTPDCLVIYGTVEAADRRWVAAKLHVAGVPWYIVKKQPSPNTEHEINCDDWLKLIIQHNTTLAWK